jgi:cell division protein FtsZ
MGILTVGIVTYPFDFEEESKQKLADEGINELGSNVDALIVIKNESLNSFYPDLELDNAFAKVDDVLLIAAKSIAELITVESTMNVDFNDVDTILRGSGTAIIGSGEAEGENRAEAAAEAAVSSPLLDTNSVYGAGKVLFFVSYSHAKKLLIKELNAITEVLANKTCNMKDTLIWGHGYDDTLGEKVRVTVIATNLHPRAEKILHKKQYNRESGGWTNEKQDESSKNSENTEQTDKRSLFPPMIKNVEQKTPTAEYVQEQPATKINQSLDNNALRNLTDEQMRSLLGQPAYQRNKVMQEHKINEISDYQVRSNGMVEHQPIYLKDKAD